MSTKLRCLTGRDSIAETDFTVSTIYSMEREIAMNVLADTAELVIIIRAVI